MTEVFLKGKFQKKRILFYIKIDFLCVYVIIKNAFVINIDNKNRLKYKQLGRT